MKTEIKERWLEALRSGNYEQGRRVLRSTDDHYCCLGVLCDLAAQEGVVEARQSSETGLWHYVGAEAYDEWRFGSSTTLPKAVAVWAELDDNNPSVIAGDEDRSLAGINDEGADFAEIADLIEEYL